MPGRVPATAVIPLRVPGTRVWVCVSMPRAVMRMSIRGPVPLIHCFPRAPSTVRHDHSPPEQPSAVENAWAPCIRPTPIGRRPRFAFKHQEHPARTLLGNSLILTSTKTLPARTRLISVNRRGFATARHFGHDIHLKYKCFNVSPCNPSDMVFFRSPEPFSSTNSL